MADLSLYVTTPYTENQWDNVGTTPYLNAQDQPTNYIYTIGRNKTSGIFSFQTTAETGTISSVLLYVYCRSDATTDFTAYVGATSYDILPAATWGWKSVDVTATLGTFTAVNSATVYFQRTNVTNRSDIDCAYLFVTYTAGATPLNIWVSECIGSCGSLA